MDESALICVTQTYGETHRNGSIDKLISRKLKICFPVCFSSSWFCIVSLLLFNM